MASRDSSSVLDDSIFDGKGTIDEIIAARDEALDLISQKARGLRHAIEELKDTGYERALTPPERQAMQDYRDLMGALAEVAEELHYMTVRALNESADVKRLINVMGAVNEGLKAKLTKIQRTSKFIKSVGDVVGIIDKMVGTITKLSGLFV